MSVSVRFLQSFSFHNGIYEALRIPQPQERPPLMIETLMHRFRGRTFGYLVAASIAGAPLPTRMHSQQGTEVDSVAVAGQVEVASRQSSTFVEPDSLEETPRNSGTSTRVQIGPVDIAPTGWRKTTRGWERADDWDHVIAATNARRLDDIVRRQVEAELASPLTRTLHHGLAWVRRFDPVTLLSIQVCMLGMFVSLIFHRESKQTLQENHEPSP